MFGEEVLLMEQRARAPGTRKKHKKAETVSRKMNIITARGDLLDSERI